MAANEDIRKVNEKLDLLIKRMEALERLLSTILGSQELVGALGLLRLSGELYRDYSDLTRRIANAQKRLKIKEIASDDLMRHILRIIVVQGPRNISEITRAIRASKGRASRSRIAQKLRALEAMGAVTVVSESAKGKTYEIA